MSKLLKVMAWTVGVVSAFVLFSESSEMLFPFQIMAGAVITAIMMAKRQGVGA